MKAAVPSSVWKTSISFGLRNHTLEICSLQNERLESLIPHSALQNVVLYATRLLSDTSK